MKNNIQHLLSLSLVILFVLCSCNYRLYKATDADWHKHWIRGYKSYRLEHRYYDKMTVKYQYHPTFYAKDAGCIFKNDTFIDCDSIKVLIEPDSKAYAVIFTKGILPCKLLSKFYGPLSLVPRRYNDVDTEIAETGIKVLNVFDFHQLTYIKTKKGHRFYQFHILPYWFYIELTNKNSNKKTPFNQFIKEAQLTWLYRSKIIDL